MTEPEIEPVTVCAAAGARPATHAISNIPNAIRMTALDMAFLLPDQSGELRSHNGLSTEINDRVSQRAMLAAASGGIVPIF